MQQLRLDPLLWLDLLPQGLLLHDLLLRLTLQQELVLRDILAPEHSAVWVMARYLPRAPLMLQVPHWSAVICRRWVPLRSKAPFLRVELYT
jgi:hypothetical protein